MFVIPARFALLRVPMESNSRFSTQVKAQMTATAKEISARAHCPYSKFPVGAAVLSANGRIFGGCNIENASFGLTICAERAAIFNAVSAGEKELIALVIYTPTPHPSAPCGACRQVMNEFGPSAHVLAVCDGPNILAIPLNELLPKAFGPESL